MTISGGVLYVGAGFNTFASPQDSSSLFMATLDATTGQPGTLTQLGNLPATPSQAQIVISAAGYIYFLQGTSANVYVAKLADVIAPGDGGADAGSPWTLSPTALPGGTPAIPLIWFDGTNLYYSPIP
ncbi:MAG TPA: hypothetical protein VK762_03670 [Polyangiaceae bacterium]|nr:hypothetical protein [Polyangiaceae bacterium]